MPEYGVKPRQSFLALAKLALRLTFRRWPLYSIGILVAFVVQALLSLFWRVPHGTELGSAIAIPMLVTLVYAFVSADDGDDPVAPSLIWERVLERAWAVIVIDFLSSELFAAGWIYSVSSQPWQMIVGLAAFSLSVPIIFADAAATVDDDVTVWSVIPRSFLRSIVTSLRAPTLIRALALFSLQLLIFVAQNALYAALDGLGEAQRIFWAEIPVVTVLTPPLAALTVLVYRDAKRAELADV